MIDLENLDLCNKTIIVVQTQRGKIRLIPNEEGFAYYPRKAGFVTGHRAGNRFVLIPYQTAKQLAEQGFVERIELEVTDPPSVRVLPNRPLS